MGKKDQLLLKIAGFYTMKISFHFAKQTQCEKYLATQREGQNNCCKTIYCIQMRTHRHSPWSLLTFLYSFLKNLFFLWR